MKTLIALKNFIFWVRPLLQFTLIGSFSVPLTKPPYYKILMCLYSLIISLNKCTQTYLFCMFYLQRSLGDLALRKPEFCSRFFYHFTRLEATPFSVRAWGNRVKEVRPDFWFSCSALFSHPPELSKRNNTQACLGKTEDRERSNQAVICVKVLCKCIITNIPGGE